MRNSVFIIRFFKLKQNQTHCKEPETISQIIRNFTGFGIRFSGIDKVSKDKVVYLFYPHSINFPDFIYPSLYQ